jgi:N-formylglutamate amidohydrolase
MNMGYKIVFNSPYQGAEIIQRHGKPFENIHAIQIEINKGLYLNEATQEKSKNFDVLKKDLEKLTHEVAEWVAT